MWKRRPPATPPTDAALVLPDGTRMPLECRYLGWQNGQHVWEATVIPWVGLDITRTQLAVGIIPPRTTVRAAIRGELLRG